MNMKKITAAICTAVFAALSLASCNIALPSGGNSSSDDSATEETTYLFQASESTTNHFSNVAFSTSEITYGTYVAQENLPGIFSEITGAVKISHHSNHHTRFDRLYLKLDYTVSDLEALKSTYKSAKFNVYFEAPPEASLIYQRGGKHMMSYVESFYSGWGSNQVHGNTWSSYEISLSDLIASMETEETASDDQTVYIFGGNCTDGHSQLDTTIYVYISNITLVKKLGV